MLMWASFAVSHMNIFGVTFHMSVLTLSCRCSKSQRFQQWFVRTSHEKPTAVGFVCIQKSHCWSLILFCWLGNTSDQSLMMEEETVSEKLENLLHITHIWLYENISFHAGFMYFKMLRTNEKCHENYMLKGHEKIVLSSADKIGQIIFHAKFIIHISHWYCKSCESCFFHLSARPEPSELF